MYVDLEVMDRFEELECIISNASSIPFSHKSGIDKEEVLELINNIKASLPEELKTQWRQSPNAKKLAEALNNNSKTGIAEQFVIHSPEGMKLNTDLIQQILNNPCE